MLLLSRHKHKSQHYREHCRSSGNKIIWRIRHLPTIMELIGFILFCSVALFGHATASVDEVISENEGKTVILPCPVNKDKCGDLHSVNWYKGEKRIAAMLLEHSNVTSVMPGFQDRVSVDQNPFGLKITDLRISDEDIYLCDTTFFIPRETCDIFNGYRIELNVLVPPTEVVIQDEKGDRIENGSIVGPMEERTLLKAACVVHNTRPPPQVGWWRGDNRLTTHSPWYKNRTDGLYIATLELELELSRTDLAQNIECRVDSAAIPITIRKIFSVDVHVRPTNITISAEKQNPKQGEKAKIVCDVYGARPQVSITWYNGSNVISPEENNLTEIRSTALKQHDNTYYTHSELSFIATRFENDQQFRCEAINSVMESNRERALIKSLVLEVTYPPVVSINPLHLVVNTGVQVLINCQYIANPASLNHVAWYRDGTLVNVSDTSHYLGGNPENVALSILAAEKEDKGKYTCELENSNGIGRSEQHAELDVHYVPEVNVIMIPDEPVKESDESNVTLYCNVTDANPPILTKVRWYADGTLLKELPDCTKQEEDLCHIDPSKLLLENIGRGFFYNYSCEGYNKAGWGPISEEKELKVFYEPGPASITYYPLTPVKGEGVTFKCKVDDPGYPEAKSFKWILRARGPQQDVPQKDFYNIEKVGLNDRTNYSCFAYNDGGQGQIATVTLDVYAPPKFIKNLGHYTGVLHTAKNFSLQCRIECVPRCEISWRRNGIPIEKTDPRYFIKEKYMSAAPATGDFESMLSVLHFNMSNWPNKKFDIAADNANYSCVSTSNIVGPSTNDSTFLSIEYAPENITTSEKVIYVEEDTIPTQRVICSSKAYPVPTYEWRINNRTIIEDSTLILNGPIKRNDSGVYTCLVSNKHGNSTAETFIDVQYKPRCEIERREIDDKDTLVCTAYGNPVEADFSWSIKAENETVESLGNGDSETDKDKSFYILDEDYAIARTYRCVANNTVGTGSFCEIEVAEQLAWWQRWDKTATIIIAASILVLLLAVIIICCIIICICRRRRRQDKYRTDVSISATQSVLSYQPNNTSTNTPPIGVAIPVPAQESITELLPDTLKKNNSTFNTNLTTTNFNNNNNNENNNSFPAFTTTTTTTTVTTTAIATTKPTRTPNLTVRHTSNLTAAHAPKSPPRWPLRPGVMVHVSNDTKENLAINRMTLKPNGASQLMANLMSTTTMPHLTTISLSTSPTTTTTTTTTATTMNYSADASIFSTNSSTFLNASTFCLLNNNINSTTATTNSNTSHNNNGNSSLNTLNTTTNMRNNSLNLLINPLLSPTNNTTTTLGRYHRSFQNFIDSPALNQTLPMRSSKSMLTTLQVNPNNEILTVKDNAVGGEAATTEVLLCNTNPNELVSNNCSDEPFEELQSVLSVTNSPHDEVIDVGNALNVKTAPKPRLERVGNFLVRIFQRARNTHIKDTTRDSQRSHVGLIGGVLSGARNVLRRRPECLNDDVDDDDNGADERATKSHFTVEHRLKGIRCSGSVTYKKSVNAAAATTSPNLNASIHSTIATTTSTNLGTTNNTKNSIISTTTAKTSNVARNLKKFHKFTQTNTKFITNNIKTAQTTTTTAATSTVVNNTITPKTLLAQRHVQSPASVTYQMNLLDNSNKDIQNTTTTLLAQHKRTQLNERRPTSLNLTTAVGAAQQTQLPELSQPLPPPPPPPPPQLPLQTPAADTTPAQAAQIIQKLTTHNTANTTISLSRTRVRTTSIPSTEHQLNQSNRSASSPQRGILKSPTLPPRPPPPFRAAPPPLRQKRKTTQHTIIPRSLQILSKAPTKTTTITTDATTTDAVTQSTPSNIEHVQINDKSSSLADPLTEPGEYENLPFHGLQTAPNKQFSTTPTNFNNNTNVVRVAPRPKRLNGNISQQHQPQQHQQPQEQQLQPPPQYYEHHSQQQYHYHQQQQLQQQQQQPYNTIQYGRNGNHQLQHNSQSQQQLTTSNILNSHNTMANCSNYNNKGIHALRDGSVVVSATANSGNVGGIGTTVPAHQMAYNLNNCFPKSYTEYYHQAQTQQKQQQQKFQNNSASNSQLLNAIEHDYPAYAVVERNGSNAAAAVAAAASTNPFLAVSNFKKFDTSINADDTAGNLTNSMHRNKRKPFFEKSEDKKFYSLKFTGGGGKHKNQAISKPYGGLNASMIIGGGPVHGFDGNGLTVIGNNNKCKRHHSFAGGSHGDINSQGTLLQQQLNNNGSLFLNVGNSAAAGEDDQGHIKSHIMRFYDPPVYENLNDSVQIHECDVESSASLAGSGGTATVLLHPQPSTSASLTHAPRQMVATATGQKKKHHHRQHQQKDDFNLIEPERLSIYRSDSGISNSSYECVTPASGVGLTTTANRHQVLNMATAKTTKSHNKSNGAGGLISSNFACAQKKSPRLAAINGTATTIAGTPVYMNVDGQSTTTTQAQSLHLERSSSPALSGLINSSYESASSSQNDGNGGATDPTSLSSCNSLYSSGNGTLIGSTAGSKPTAINSARCNRHQKQAEITTPEEYEQYQLGHHTHSTSSLSVASSVSASGGHSNAMARSSKTCKKRSTGVNEPLSAAYFDDELIYADLESQHYGPINYKAASIYAQVKKNKKTGALDEVKN